MSPRKRKPKSGEPASRRSPRKVRVTKKAKHSKSRSKLPRKAAAVRPLPSQPEEILFRVEGKMSTFGGPHDLGMAANEDLALFTKADLQDPKYAYLFLPASPPGTSGHTISPVVGIILQRQGSFCGALLHASRIPQTVEPRTRVRSIGDRILLPDVSQTYRQDWQLRSDLTRTISLG